MPSWCSEGPGQSSLRYTGRSEDFITTLQISDELAEQIAHGTHVTGETKDAFLREAVLSRLEDIQDRAIAREYLRNPDTNLSLDEMKQNLGLGD